MTNAAGVDLTVLATELTILPSAPPWVATEPALKRLEEYGTSRRMYPQYQEDVDSVRDYAAMLAAQQRTLTNALFCGAVVGRFTGADFNTGLRAGLQAISSSFRFRDSRRAGPSSKEAMALLARAVCERYPDYGPLMQRLYHSLSAQENGSWSQRLHELASAVASAKGLSEDERQAVVQRAWDERRGALTGVTTDLTPSVDALCCRVAGIGPGTLLRDQTDQMTLAEWSTAYHAAVLGKAAASSSTWVPRWLAPVAAIEMGLAPSWEAATMTVKSEGLTVQDWVALQVKAQSKTAPRLSALIVIGDPSSAASRWPTAPGYAAVMWTARQAIDLLEAVTSGDRPAGLPDFQQVFIETTTDRESVPRIVALVKEWASRPHIPVTAFRMNRSSISPPWAARLVADPADAAALLRTAEVRRIGLPDDLPPSLKRVWENGAQLLGTLEGGGQSHIAVEVRPREPGIELTWFRDTRRQSARLWFSGDDFIRRDRLIERQYSIGYDGVTLRVEQRDAWLRWYKNPIGRWLARTLAPAQTVELREERGAWLGDVIVRRRDSVVRMPIRLEVGGPPRTKAAPSDTALT